MNTRFLTPEVSVSAAGVLGIHQGFDVTGYLDTRPWQYCGSGALYFHDPAPAMDAFFEEGVHYVGYSKMDVNSLVEKFLYYTRERKDLGAKIREEAFKYVKAHHTAKHRIKAVFDILDGKDVKSVQYLNDIKNNVNL